MEFLYVWSYSLQSQLIKRDKNRFFVFFFFFQTERQKHRNLQRIIETSLIQTPAYDWASFEVT